MLSKKLILPICFFLLCITNFIIGEKNDFPPKPQLDSKFDYKLWIDQLSNYYVEENAGLYYKHFFNIPGLRLGYKYLKCENKKIVKQIDEILENPIIWDQSEYDELEKYLKKISPYFSYYINGSKVKEFKYFITDTEELLLPYTGNSEVLTKTILISVLRNDIKSNSRKESLIAVFNHSKHIRKSFYCKMNFRLALKELKLAHKIFNYSLREKLLNEKDVTIVKKAIKKSSQDLLDSYYKTALSELAMLFDKIQKVAELSFLTKVHFDKQKVKRELPFSAEKKFYKQLLDESPNEIIDDLLEYTQKLFKLSETMDIRNCNKTENLYKKHKDKYKFYELFGLFDLTEQYRDILEIQNYTKNY